MVDWNAFYAAFRSPDFIPGYEIQNHLGGGAFGEVYRARKRSIGKAYAIKFVRLEAGHGAAEEELEQVRLFASIDHPHLVTIEDMGVVLGVPYLIMGYAGEDTLARRLARGELEPEKAVRFFVQACRGVLALHDRRLAHFDLKPSNVFLRGDIARVGDYGLAKLVVGGGQLPDGGTPRYMAPEMAGGQADHRADIYSLGLILHESLLGSLPCDSVARSDPGAGRAAHSLPPDVPPLLRSVIERCLRRDPDDRYASLHQLLDELGQTARQGDSIRVRYGGLSDELKELQRGSPNMSAGPIDPRPEEGVRPERVGKDAGDEDSALDQRGSAKRSGVPSGPAPLEGVEEAKRDDRTPGAPLRPRADTGRPNPSDDVVSTHALTESEQAAPVPNAEAQRRATETTVYYPSDQNAPWRRELDRTRRVRNGEALPEDQELPLEPIGAWPGPGTIPVPPRADGGWFGNVTQSVIVGGEIMGALVTGPIFVAARGTARQIDRLLKGFHGIVGSSLRFLLVLILLALLGAGVTLVVLAALALKA